MSLYIFSKPRLNSFLICGILLSCNVTVKAQTSDVSNDAVASLATYTSSYGRDKTAMLLEEIGYLPADNLKAAWNGYPAIKKLETAYIAAGANGDKMLAAITTKLSAKYESVSIEEALAGYMKTGIAEKVSFTKTGTTSKNIPTKAKSAILSISKYSDAKALGGLRGMLKYYYNLPDANVYEVLSNSNTTAEALQNGLKAASAGQEDRIKLIIDELQKNYESARNSAELKNVRPIKALELMPNGQTLNVTIPETNFAKQYREYLLRNGDMKSMNFDVMIKNKLKWGGIIFGNKITTGGTLTRKLKSVVWIQDEKATEGTLEFRFENEPEPLVIMGVQSEDVYAAYEILYTNNYSLPAYKSGDGIGLVSAERIFYNETNRGKQDSNTRLLIVHPGIAKTELGRSLARADVFLRTGGKIKGNIARKYKLGENEEADLSQWTAISSENYGWKYTDAPMTIDAKDLVLNVSRTDAKNVGSASNYVDFSYTGSQDISYKQFAAFSKIFTYLKRTYYDYNRLNSFAKTFAVLRWAKDQNAKFMNKPILPATAKTPERLVIDRQKGSVELVDLIRAN